MVYIKGADGGKKLPRQNGKGKVVWLEVPKQDMVIDAEKGRFKMLVLSLMLHQGQTKDDTKTMRVTVGDVDFSKPEFSGLKRIDEIFGKNKDERRFPIIEFEYYTSEQTAKDKDGKTIYEEQEIVKDGRTVIRQVPKLYLNHRMSIKDCETIKIIAEDSDPPIWHKEEESTDSSKKEAKEERIEDIEDIDDLEELNDDDHNGKLS